MLRCSENGSSDTGWRRGVGVKNAVLGKDRNIVIRSQVMQQFVISYCKYKIYHSGNMVSKRRHRDVDAASCHAVSTSKLF